MAREFNIAIVGATGAVGLDLLRVLEDRKFPVKNLRLLASSRSAGKQLTFRAQDCPVEELGVDSFKDIDIAFFSAGASRSKEFAHLAVKSGAIVIDNSSAFRMEKNVPLVVPEINPQDIKEHSGIIANPNCSTIIMLVPLYPIHRVSRIRRIIVATYQAVSGTGMKAIKELENQVKQWAKGDKLDREIYPHQIAFNALPHVDVFLEDGYTKEEAKMLHETRKILHDDAIQVSATCVRVPVFRSHSEAVHIELEKPMASLDAKQLLKKAPGVQLCDDPSKNIYPLATNAAGQYDILVGRIREDSALPNGLALWVCGDQLLKGAALNAVQIAEHL